MTLLHKVFASPEQEVRDPDGIGTVEEDTNNLLPAVTTMLEIFVDELESRSLGHANYAVEFISIVPHPHYRSCCDTVYRNGGPTLQAKVRNVVEATISSFTGVILSDDVNVAQPQPSPAELPTKLRKMEQMRLDRDASLGVGLPQASPSVEVTRTERANAEFQQYMSNAIWGR